MAAQNLPRAFGAFTAAGWALEAPSTSNSQYLFQPPAGGTPQGRVTEEIDAQKRLGIVGDDGPCTLWRSSAQHNLPAQDDLLRDVKMALRNAVAAISGSRIAATALQHSGWCLAALQALEACLNALKSGISNRQLWPDVNKDRSPEAFALKGAIKAIMSSFHTCLEILDDFPAPSQTHLDPESVVYVVANLDSMYYVLLDHHLTATWATPPVPPPHTYFPALVAAMGTEVRDAVQSLMQRGGPVAAANFCRAWDLSESLELPSGVDPLREVMWARWQEAAVLLFHRGLGTHGEMDAALEEEAGFKTWMANHSSHRDSPAVDSPQAGITHNNAASGGEQLPAGDADGCGEPGMQDDGMGGAPGAARSALGTEPMTIGGMPAAELDHAIQAVLAAGAGDLSDVDGEGGDEEDDAVQLERLAGVSLGASDAETATGLKPPPTAYTALQVFRESAREWPCHLYAFAAPNNRALKALAQLAPLIEIGAGVGYWALLLRKSGVTVVATDELPTSKCTHGTVNTYHGQIPPVTEVLEAPANVAAKHKDRTLFLCYAPPDSTMAEDALEAYSGEHVAVIGEWDGDTGTTAFARTLLLHWDLQEAIALPNWSDTSHDLTIWRRKPAQDQMPLSAAPWPVCCASGITLGECMDRNGRGLRRCRHLRLLLFSDKPAFESYQAEADQAMALSFVFFQRPLQFDSNGDFDDVNIL